MVDESEYLTAERGMGNMIDAYQVKSRVARVTMKGATYAIFMLLLGSCANKLARAQDWLIGPWRRGSEKPIIQPNPEGTFLDPVSTKDVHWEALHTFNPAAVVRNGKVVVLYRAEDNTGEMKIGGHV